VRIKHQIIAEIENHARECAPNECCGLLAGCSDLIERLYPLSNIAATPDKLYFADPREILSATKLMRARGEGMLGIYHSHPNSAACPSPTDIEQAYYPEAAYFIISLEPRVELRAFFLRDGIAKEIDFEIQED
jgi:[CysO sulfur-carrier protein]-S-L-cysteine hydrolase